MINKVLKYGLIAGLILAVLLWIMLTLCARDLITFGNSAIVGFAGMFIAFSLIYFCIRSYRDDVNGGVVTIWQALLIGLMVIVVASVMHSLGWAVYNWIFPDFKEFYIQKYTEYLAVGLGKQASQAEIDSVKSQVEMMRMVYENPLLDFAMCTLMMLPPGLIVTIISAIALRKKRSETGSEQAQ